jgi:hypothetical protein
MNFYNGSYEEADIPGPIFAVIPCRGEQRDSYE